MSVTQLSGRLDTFFEQRAKHRTLRPQIAIALLAGVMFALDMGVIYFSLGDAVDKYGGVAIILMVGYLFIPSLLWLVGTFSTYIFGRLIGAQLQFSVLFRTTGWGMLPLVGAGASLAFGRYFGLQAINACTEAGLECELDAYVTLSKQVSDIYAYAGMAQGSDLYFAGAVVSILCLVLTGALWVVAAENTSTLTRAGALVTAGVPSLLLTVVYALFLL